MARHPRPRTRVTLVQFTTAVLMFAVLSVLGGVLVAGLVLPVASVTTDAAKATADLFEDLPESVAQTELPQQSNIYDRTGKHLLATFYSQNRVVVPLEQISPWIQKAVVAVEDKRFWQHNGVDGQGIARAAYTSFTSSKTTGGSTLTQQLIKNILLQKGIADDDTDEQKAATEVSLTRKIREWRLALGYEEKVNAEYGTGCTDASIVDCGKKQVLEQYLNIAQFGSNRLYGVEAAAEVYFGKHASELNVIEAATIAGITQNPSKWDPLRHPLAAQKRRNVVLLTMYEQGMISKAEYHTDRAVPIANTLDPHRPKVSCAAAAEAPFFCDYVTRIIATDAVFNNDSVNGDDLLNKTGGLTIITTLDYDKQVIANEELEKSMSSTDKSGWAMALVSLDPATGQILAMSENRTYDPSGDEPGSTTVNYAVDRAMGGSRGFSPGSTFKPIVLATWLGSGRSLMQTINATQKTYKPTDWTASCQGPDPFKGSPSWKPGNAEGEGGGQMTVLRATAKSINTGYVAMANELDLCDIANTAASMGFHRADGVDFQVLPSSTLGTQNASPLTMASVAQTIANGGVHCEPTAILSVTGVDGQVYDVPQPNCQRAISADVAAGITYAMQDVIKYGSGTTAKLSGGRPAAGKTGTSQNNAHLWFMGFTPQLVATVWMGNPAHDEPGKHLRINGTTYRILWGSSISAPTWKHFMDRVLKGEDAQKFPSVSNDVLYGVPQPVPTVVGLTEDEAKKAINDAGFSYAKSDTVIFDTSYPAGTVVAQGPDGSTKALPGSTITYFLGTDQRPGWWFNWPPGWDPTVPPADYTGDVWPPPEFADNPPFGWPGNDQGGPGNGGWNGGWNGGGNDGGGGGDGGDGGDGGGPGGNH